ncbi:MAG TPA: PfaD family polyunsaturated fatty acid/polyketide biosynthesis protein [Anaerolineaceae bacterium]|nr:PfaD family polyunsaturated fatty acid/polyketide biosynthesis protein [Anaerolineaceae bacterium]
MNQALSSTSSNSKESQFEKLPWNGNQNQLVNQPEQIAELLQSYDQGIWAIKNHSQVFLTSTNGYDSSPDDEHQFIRLAYVPPMPLESLGDPAFIQTYGTRYAYYAGAMANGISSVEMVIALGKAGLMGSFGSAGLSPARIEAALQTIQQALPTGPYAINLIHSPNEPMLERHLAELYLRTEVRVIEASAYMDLTYALVHFRVAGLSRASDGSIHIHNRIIAKVSRKEVARKFMLPAPQDLLRQLLADGKITAEQAELALQVPMADDVTVEADSGGHTDNRPMTGLIPTMLVVRDEVQSQMNYPQPVRVGAGGGVSTPASALAAFMMGAAYVVTGSVNQACVEAGASNHTRALLAQADMADVIMAPAADMFEMGVRVQVLKRGSMFAMRASRLYELYSRYNSIEEIPNTDREKIEKTIFKRSLEEIWEETQSFFKERDQKNLDLAYKDPHHKMALIFRWYLGLSSRWSVVGEPGREMDYQIWCGPAMGSFNQWVKGSVLEPVENRKVVDIAMQILSGVAYLARVRSLASQGISLPADLQTYYPPRLEETTLSSE